MKISQDKLICCLFQQVNQWKNTKINCKLFQLFMTQDQIYFITGPWDLDLSFETINPNLTA